MYISPSTIRAQMFKIKPLLASRTLETIRKGQNLIGGLMVFRHRKSVMVKEHKFEKFVGAWMIPKEERRQGVILYFHGGGYVCGDLQYAKGFSSTLAVECGVKVFSPAYRLAPENPYPAALDDAIESYKYLLKKGYSPNRITLCGESAGGGLCYSLCLKLKEIGLPMPAGIIAISPWADLTASGVSYKENIESDPSITKEILDFFRDSYTEEPSNPFVSPVFADLSGFPSSIIFAAKEELMRSDSELLNEKLHSHGCESTLYLKSDRWHVYLLYGLSEDRDDFTKINQFINKVVAPEQKLRWFRLDNAAKIFPAARSKTWSNVFRVSVNLKEDVDVKVLKSALDITARRFPSMCARLRRGLFWYHIEQLPNAPEIRKEECYPLTRMNRHEIGKSAIRVIVYKNRIAVEIFHSLTDGNGAMIFLKTLTAEYLTQKYGVSIPAEFGVLGRLEEPSHDELEDSFQKYAGPVQASRREKNAFNISGTPEPQGFLNLTCFKIPIKDALSAAHKYNVSLTVFLTAALMQSLQAVQSHKYIKRKRRKAIKILLPVNLRNVFESKSLRNFVLYTTPEIDPKQGDYTFEEICKIVNLWMATEITKKKMSAKIASNIYAEQILFIRLMPLFIKNLIMKAVYSSVGERKYCLSMSNLGNAIIPDEMKPFVERFDFILGVQANAHNNCGVISFGDTLYMNFLRSLRESDLELQFFKTLQEQGLRVSVESNLS